MQEKDLGRVSRRAREIPPFIVMDVLERAQEMEQAGHHIIHLEVGEPDFDTPEPILEAGYRALRQGDTHYTHSLGKRELREEIAAYYLRKYGVEVSPDRILVTAGTSPAMLLLFSALLERGEEVILPNPYYACYPNIIRYAEGNPVLVNVREEEGFKYKLEDIRQKISPRTRAVMVNSPSNPTGNVFDREELQALADLQPYIVSDEIYHGLIYEGSGHSMLEFTDRAFILDGFSKRYAMTGWRLGYVIVPPEFVRPMQKLQQNLFICAASFVQEAGIAALREGDPYVARMAGIYNERRRYLLGRLRAMGIATAVEPTGAFYALANIKKYTSDSYAFAFQALEEARVAVTPGIDFGSNCEGYIRISYAYSLNSIAEGMDRLEGFLKGLPESR
jgi:(5-formylfuran-3-yl)methyl phosphate transaminase